MAGVHGGWRFAGWVALGVALAALVAWPLLRLAAEGIVTGPATLAGAVGEVGLVAMANSLWTSIAATLLAVGGAFGLALLTERRSGRGIGWLRAAVLLPLLVPDFVTAMSWGRAYGPAGLVDRLVGWQLPGLYGPFGVVLVLAVSALPLAYLIVVAGLRVRAEPDLERAARASAASATAAFRTITIPVLAPVLLAAAGLGFVTSVNAFGTPAVLGSPAGFSTMTTRIYQDLAFSASDQAFARVIGLSLVLVVVAALMVLAADRVAPMVQRVGAPTAAPSTAPAPWWALTVSWGFVAIGVAVPLVALVLTALTSAVGLPPVPQNLTFANFGRALDGQALAALGNSLILATLAACVVVLLSLLVTGLFGSHRRRRLGGAVTLTFALPGSVLAVAVLLAYGAALRDTIAIILLAYVAKLWALGQRPITAGAEQLPGDLVRAARVSGANAASAARTILVPMLLPMLAAAWLLVFVYALHEVTISILLYGSGTATLAVVILNLQQLGDPLVTSALAVILTGLVMAAVALLLLVRRIGWSGVATP